MSKLSEQILSTFDRNAWTKITNDILDSIDVRDSQLRGNLHTYMDGYIENLRDLAELMSDDLDQEHLKRSLTFWYVEAKSRWYQLNDRMNYRIARGEPSDGWVVVRGSLDSTVLETLETVFELNEIEVLAHYLFEPLPSAEDLHRYRVTAKKAA